MLSWFYELITAFASVLTSVLPLSPFQQYIKAFAGLPYLGILNWFDPDRCICEDWCGMAGCDRPLLSLFYRYALG